MRSQPLQIFISYARKDERHLLDLKEHLSGLSRDGIFEIWFDGEIVAGHEWRREIFQRLERADVVLLLVSPAYFASAFCMLESELALELRHLGKVRVLPILIRHVDWSSSPFADLQFLAGGEPVPESGAARDFSFAQIARKLREVAAEIQKSLQTSATPRDPLDSLDEPARLNEMALTLAETGGEPRAAIEMLDRALFLCRHHVGGSSGEIAILLSNRGQAYQDIGDLAKARADMERAVAMAKSRYGLRHHKVALYMANLGGILLELGEDLKALDVLEDAVTFLEKSPETDRRAFARARIFLAGALASIGKTRKAEELLEVVLATQPTDFQITAAAHSALGRIARREGRLRKSKTHFEAALEIAREAFGNHHPFVALNLHNLGLNLRESGDRRANDLLRRALDVFTEKLGAGSPRAQWTRAELDGVSVQSG